MSRRTRRIRLDSFRTVRPGRFRTTIADRLAVSVQRLRTDEVLVEMTRTLADAAKWQARQGGAR